MSSISVLKRLSEAGPRAVSLAFPKDSFRLHAMVTSAGYDHPSRRQYDWHGLRRGTAPFVLLQHTIGGQGELRFGERRHTLRPGQTMLLAFPHDNRYWLPPGGDWEFFWFCLNGREVLRLWQEAMADGPVVEPSAGCVERLAARCLSLLAGQARSAAQASAAAYGVAMDLADDLLSWGELHGGAERPEPIARAIALCERQPDAGIDVERMAREAGYSRYHFTRLFTRSEGVAPARFLLRLRMERAARLLQTDRRASVKVIARACGFEDANYFTRAFRACFGVAPREFRTSGMFAGLPPEPEPGASRRAGSV